MNKKSINQLTFTDEEIDALFGNEAAENERPERLKEYYFKNDAYNQIIANLPFLENL